MTRRVCGTGGLALVAVLLLAWGVSGCTRRHVSDSVWDGEAKPEAVEERFPIALELLRGPWEGEGQDASQLASATVGESVAIFGVRKTAAHDPWQMLTAEPSAVMVPILVGGRPAAEFTFDGHGQVTDDVSIVTEPSQTAQIDEAKRKLRLAFPAVQEMKVFSSGRCSGVMARVRTGEVAVVFWAPADGPPPYECGRVYSGNDVWRVVESLRPWRVTR